MLEESILIPVVGMMVPVFIVGIVFLSTYQRRKLEHAERLAMIEKGILPEQMKEMAAMPITLPRSRSLNGSVTTAAIGIALLLGLGTIGIGPWLLGGLIPLAVGIGGIISYVVTSGDQKKDVDLH